MRRIVARVVLAVLSVTYLWAVGTLTLRAQPYGEDLSGALDRLLGWFAQQPRTAWITFDLIEFWANVAMFVPLGVIAVLWFGLRGWWTAPVLGLLISGVIEGVQALFLDTRVPDARDLFANTLGAVIGMMLIVVIAFLLSPARPRATGSLHA